MTTSYAVSGAEPSTQPSAPSAPAHCAGSASIEVARRWPRRQRRPGIWIRIPSIALLAVSVAVMKPSTGRASIFGEETAVLSAILAENISEVAQAVQTVTHLYTQIRQLTTMIEQGSTMLQKFDDPQDVLRMLRLAQSTLREEGAIERDVSKLQYKLAAIDKDTKEVFPEMQNVPTHEFQAKAKSWYTALKESKTVAMRAQTSVETLGQRLEFSTKLQRDSEAAEGIVGQLQLIQKALALLHTDLSAIEQNLAYGERVTATMAGVQAAEEERASEEGRRMLENFRHRGSDPRRLEALP